MKVKITENTVVKGEIVSAGAVIEVPGSEARILQAANKCKVLSESEETRQDHHGEDDSPGDENLEYVKSLSDDELKKEAKELKIDVRGMSREQAEKVLAEAMSKL